jgi:pyridoxal phosphate enzyme (YggS family)
VVVDVDVVRDALARASSAIADAERRAGRPAGATSILAAVKYVTRDDLAALQAAGIARVGENRTDALLAKQPGFEAAFRWDFIGHLQSRKVRDLVDRVDLVHALSSESAARQIDERSSRPQRVLVEVNVAGDPGKEGVAPAALDPFLEVLAGLERLQVCGLMTMPPFAADPEESRGAFATLRELADGATRRWSGTHAFSELSMGTSQDYAVAVEEGATVVRLGGVLYGGRPAA